MKKGKFLAVALLMTVLGASAMAYAHENADGPHKEHGGQGWEHHGGMMSGLSEEKRKLLHDTMEKVRKDNAPLHEQKRKLHAEMDALLVAPQFDQEAYTKKTAEMDTLKARMQANRKQGFAGIFGQFSQEERIELVVMQHMKHHHRMMMRHHAHWHGGKEEHHAGMMPKGQEDAPPQLEERPE